MLKKLKLVGTRLAWEDLNIIGKWPNLEVLKLKPDACRGTEWYQIEATNDHFPAPKHLVIRHSLHLQEIPIEFADIYSLQLIELQNCSAKPVASARRVQEDQESLGSKAGNVRLNTSDVMNGVLEFVDHTSNNTVNDGLGPEWISSEIRTSPLHFGIFREDSEIPEKKLIRSWMAVGFLKLENDLQGEAEKYLQELVDRCLVLIFQKSLDGTKVRSCKSLFISNYSKVLDLSHVRIDSFPVQILNLIWLRYLALFIYVNLKIPREICRLWNLRTFIVKGIRLSVITFPEEIWGLMQLRHFKLSRFYLPDCPSGSVDKGRHLDFSNIQTISYLSQRCCTKEVIMGIQNVKELGISGGDEIDSNGPLNNLVHLQQLETLSFIFCLKILSASAKAFPATLKKLKLERTLISWSYLDIIAELPNLKVLKLMAHACLGDEWHPNVQGFTRLKILLIEDNFLKHWKATDENFLVLEHLVLKKCHNLKEIPIEFA
ncbi:hypothetical protein T459_24579 [Capsicum annuum]|uniref:Disease resistance protein winged helix domain-containing protein n=1 Tax=Capsicum annuum TaxID=4072 RepID=A0A2G2YVR4_CAPAN|nr:hypothetical protein T459_24579 [Capsicum annuum]